MSFLWGSLPNTRSPESQAPSTVRLHGYWLIVARVVWLAIVVPTLLLYVANIPAYFASLPCSSGAAQTTASRCLSPLL
jgi:hypothetical protein